MFDANVRYRPCAIYMETTAMRCSVRVKAAVAEMLLMTLMLTAARLSDVIDPCHPRVPCDANSNMSDPLGDCSVYYMCEASTRLWQRMQCGPQNNETTHYDQTTALCVATSSQPTCHGRCSGQ